jgi:hypothetical protein
VIGRLPKKETKTMTTQTRVTVKDELDWFGAEYVKDAYRRPDGTIDAGAMDGDRSRWQLEHKATLKDGAYFWNSNGNPVPPDFFFAHVGGLNPDGTPQVADLRDLLPAGQEAAQRAYLDRVMAEYRAAKPRRLSAEEKFEIDANFEPGERIVDIFTGRTVRRVPKRRRTA